MSDAVEKSNTQEGYKTVVIGPSQVTIPDHWSVRKLGDVTKIVSGNTPKKSNPDYWGGDIVWITPTDVTALDGKYISESEERITEAGLANSSASLVEPGAVLMTSRATIGEVVINEFPVTTNQGFKTLVPNEDLYCEYLYYYIPSIKQYLNAIGGGSTFSEISKSDVSSIKIPIPPIPEQQRIADILSTVDEQIQQTDEVIGKTKELKQGLMQDLLIHGLSSGSTQEVQIGPRTLQIPAHWDMEPCGQLFEAINGRGFKPEEWEEEGTQIIRIQDLRPGADAETNYANFEVDDKYHVTDGDLLFCWAGNINTSLGAYIWSGDDAYLNQHIYNLRPKKELNKCFFAFSLNQHLRLLKTMVGGSAGQVHITKGDFEAFKLPVPPVEEQERIGDIIGCVQKKIDEEKGKSGDLQDLKRGLMQDLLTGKVRVNTD